MATTQRLAQPATGAGGATRATAKARVSKSDRKQPPPELRTCHSGAKAKAAESPPPPPGGSHEPPACAQSSRPRVERSTGELMPSDNSTVATMRALAPCTRSTRALAARSLQALLAPLAATLHCQWTFQKSVVTSRGPSSTTTSPMLFVRLAPDAPQPFRRRGSVREPAKSAASAGSEAAPAATPRRAPTNKSRAISENAGMATAEERRALRSRD
mmetsp:Transcript_64183/g.209407  ORF Transcript_64183/g.209407 Transcript_64183/m.209407 type:complete len:215 (-) Transcript_64183:3-647(-)